MLEHGVVFAIIYIFFWCAQVMNKLYTTAPRVIRTCIREIPRHNRFRVDLILGDSIDIPRQYLTDLPTVLNHAFSLLGDRSLRPEAKIWFNKARELDTHGNFTDVIMCGLRQCHDSHQNNSYRCLHAFEYIDEEEEVAH